MIDPLAVLRDTGEIGWGLLAMANLSALVSVALFLIAARGRRVPAAAWLAGPALVLVLALCGSLMQLHVAATQAALHGDPSLAGGAYLLWFTLTYAVLGAQLACVGTVASAWLVALAGWWRAEVEPGQALRAAALPLGVGSVAAIGIGVAGHPILALLLVASVGALALAAAVPADADAGSRPLVTLLAVAAVTCWTLGRLSSRRALLANAVAQFSIFTREDFFERMARIAEMGLGLELAAVVVVAGLGSLIGGPVVLRLWRRRAVSGLVAVAVAAVPALPVLVLEVRLAPLLAALPTP